MNTSPAELERNKAIVRSFKECQGTKDQDATMREIMAPNYNRVRGGLINLAENAEGQDFPGPGLFLRKALPDRVDAIEDIVAEGDRVAMIWRLNATHTGNLFGIPPTGRRIDIYEVGFFRLADGKIVEGWFMCDELGLLMQLGRQMPKRRDGGVIAPHVTEEGEAADALIERVMSRGTAMQPDRNKLEILRSKSSKAQPQRKSADYVQSRSGFHHLHDYGRRNGLAASGPNQAFPDRTDRIVRLVAEEDKVWTQFNLHGTHSGSFYDIAATNKRCVVSEIGICRFAGDEWVQGWYFADELGLLLQLNAVHVLEKLGCQPV
jgi:predicted ester cyclase